MKPKTSSLQNMVQHAVDLIHAEFSKVLENKVTNMCGTFSLSLNMQVSKTLTRRISDSDSCNFMQPRRCHAENNY